MWILQGVGTLGIRGVGGRRALLALAALALVAYLASVATARADFGATDPQLDNPSLHAAVVSCGPTSGCVVGSNAHVVPEGDDKKRITEVQVYLPSAIYVVDVVVMREFGFPAQFEILARSETTPTPVNAFASVHNLQLKDPLTVRAGQYVGLYIRGFQSVVPLNFHDTRNAPFFPDGRIANSNAWTGRSGDPGEMLPISQSVMNDPGQPELSGKFALMLARFITSKARGADLRVTKKASKGSKGKTAVYKAPNASPKFTLNVKNKGKKPAKKVEVTDTQSNAFWPLAVKGIKVRAGKTSKPVSCKKKNGNPVVVVCKTKKMEKGDKFTVVIKTRIVPSLPVLSYRNLLAGGRLTYLNEASVSSGKTNDPAPSNNLSEVPFEITTGGGTCPSDIVEGTNAGDRLQGGLTSQTILGLGGRDLIDGDDGGDCILGGEGPDVLNGDDGSDWVDGGPGDDRIFTSTAGGPGDGIWGDTGNDKVFAVNGSKDVIDCGPGKDTVQADKKIDEVAGNCEKVKKSKFR
jgi:hypothetical protein